MGARHMPYESTPTYPPSIRVAVVGEYSSHSQRLRTLADAITIDAHARQMTPEIKRRLALALREVADEIEAEPPQRARWWRTAFARWWGA